MVPSLCAVTGFSIFMASSTTTRSPADDLLALLDGHLDDGALHRRGDRVTGGGRTACAPRLRGLGFLRITPADGAAAAAADRQVAGQRHLDAAAADLDDDLLPREGVLLVDRLAAGERLDRVVPLGLDPAGVDVEAFTVADERGIGHHGAVERDDGGQALDV